MSKFQKMFYTITLIVLCLSFIFIIFAITEGEVFIPLAITFVTTLYHFVMRITVGFIVRYGVKGTFKGNEVFFKEKIWEKKLYNILKVKSWKAHVPTFIPEDFDVKNIGLDRVIHNMCIAELSHALMSILSFVPLFAAIFFGEFFVFLITSVIAAFLECVFIMLQRYNRPRLIAVREKLK